MWWCYGLCALIVVLAVAVMWWCYYLFVSNFLARYLFSIICPCYFSLSQEAAAGDHEYVHTSTYTNSQ